MDAGVQRPHTTRSATSRVRSSPSSPATGRILAMVAEPELRHEPARLPRHDAVNDLRTTLLARPGGPAVRPRDRRRSQPARLDVQARRRVGRARASGDYTPESTLPEPGVATSCRSRAPSSQRERRHVRPGRHGDHRRRAAPSCNIPFAELGVELGDTAIREEAEKYGFNTSFELPLASTASSYPRALDDPQTALTGVRPGAGHGDAAADGDGVGRHRERRNGHEPTHGGAGDRRRPVGAADVRATASSGGHSTRTSPPSMVAMMVANVSRRRGVGCKNRRGRGGR